ncbi:MAG: carboxymuconolactone decarboxylase family protein [Acidimicrobiales bacterium]
MVRRGLTEEQVSQALGRLDDAQLPPPTVAALRLADALTEPGEPTIPAAVRAELAEHFDDGQLLELAMALSVASGWQRMIEAFDIRPDLWSEATPKPVRPER